MCGICGIVYHDRERPVDAGTLAGMVATLAHRGPDDEGAYRAPGVGIGVRRLAIVDPAGGRQPIANETGDVLVVCNGEIYNHPELRAELAGRGHRFATGSDVETIVHLYEERGPACVERLRGMFAFALWDAQRRRLLLARDRLGIKPLDYAAGAWGLAFGSESKAVLASGHVRAELRPEAVDDVLALGYVLSPGTSFVGIRRLEPGHVLVVEDGAMSMRRYWELPVPGSGRHGRLDARALALEYRERLEESVRIHLRADVPVGAYLSGGIDSSAMVALMERNGVERPAAYTLSFTDASHDEIADTRLLDQFPGHDIERRPVESDYRDVALLPRAVWHSEHLTGINFGFPDLRLARRASESFKAVVSGEGSDETLHGYWWYMVEPWGRLFSKLPGSVRRWGIRRGRRRSGFWPWAGQLLLAPPGPGLERFASIAGPPGSQDRAELLAPGLAGRLVPAPERWPALPAERAGLHPVEQLQYWDVTTRLRDFVLHNVDRIPMAHAIEVRVPFLDHELVEWAVGTIPWRANTFPRAKATLRRAMEGVLPEPIRKRPKRPHHPPYEAWMRGPLPPFADALLSESALADKGIFRPAAVRAVCERHRAGREERGLQLLTVLAFQVWDELFVRGRSPSEVARMESPTAPSPATLRAGLG